jgi:hypothetical protein
MANNQVLDLTPGQLTNIFEPQRLHQWIPFDSRAGDNLGDRVDAAQNSG